MNVERDRRQTLDLEALGWKVVRVWEHEVYEELAQVVERVRQAAQGRAIESASDWRVVAVEELDALRRLERRYLEQLGNALVTKTEEGRRVTAKWRRGRAM